MLIKTSEMVVPRIELRWSDRSDDGLEKICWYNIVLPLKDIDKRIDYHEGVDKETQTLHIPVCHTIDRVKSHVDPAYRGPVMPDDKGGYFIEMPYSDKMHAVWDAGVLNLPLYVSYKDQAQLVAKPGLVTYCDEFVLSGNMGLHR